jgi:tRNA/rRNA methyltransferase
MFPLMSGTDRNRPVLSGGPVIILAEPQLGENIGMVARAMANFGLANLRLVNPRDGWPNDKASAAASGASQVIAGAAVFATVEAAVADLTHVYATTARRREMIKPVIGPGELAARIRESQGGGGSCGILFGRERWGLNNHEISLCDAIVTFPVNPAFASLNIAQAVLLVAYEWMRSRDDELARQAFTQNEVATASRNDLIGLVDHLQEALEEADYFYPPEKKDRMLLNLRNIFTHAQLSEPEIRTLRGVVAALQRRWTQGRKRA